MLKSVSVFVMSGMLCLHSLNASPLPFDVFGVDEKSQQEITNACSGMMKNYLQITKNIFHSSKARNQKNELKMKELHDNILSKVNKLGDYSLSEISLIDYPKDKKIFATIDLVRREDKNRLLPEKNLVHKTKFQLEPKLNQLFQIWDEYDDHNIQLLRSGKLTTTKPCPVTHCTWGYDEKESKEILPVITKGVKDYKKQLMQIVKKSDNDNLRAKTIFILAHDSSNADLSHLLIRYINDPDSTVRNNSMRVLGAIAEKYKLSDSEIKKVINALDYPLVTDRNKAAFIIHNVIKNDPSKHSLVVKSAGAALLKLLKLQQPNNHDFAYQILKEISHQNYSEHDYQSWERWIKTQIS